VFSPGIVFSCPYTLDSRVLHETNPRLAIFVRLAALKIRERLTDPFGQSGKLSSDLHFRSERD
jgi:hypothetical protein